MRKLMIFPAILLLLSLAACSYGGVTVALNSQTVQGSGSVSSEQRPVSGVTKVELKSIGNLTITQGDSESLTVSADDNLLPYITTAVDGDTLTISTKPNYNITPSKTIEYKLTVKSLSSVVLSGFGNINADKLSGDDLELRVSGSGNINVGDVSAKRMEVHLTGFGNITLNTTEVNDSTLDLTGSGDLKVNTLNGKSLNLTLGGLGTASVSGKVNDQTIQLTGSGNYQGGDLESSSAAVTISGLGDATVWAKDSLDLKITGSGNIKYYDNPKLSQSITGLGNITSLGAH